MKLRIKVTKEILEQSKNCVAEYAFKSCAVSLAVRDIFPRAAVLSNAIMPLGPHIEVKVPLPSIAVKFIEQFDTSFPSDRPQIPELEFEIDIPESVINTIDITEITKLLQDHPTLELV